MIFPCPSQKMVFESRKTANRMKREYGVPGTAVYRCPRCGQYHLTSARGEKSRRYRKARRGL